MPTRTIAVILSAALCLTQLPAGVAQQPASSTAPATVIVPAGTVFPLTLVNPIKSKSTKPGDSIRAVVAFPITVDGQVAVPAGTYVEGTLAPPLPKVKHQPDPDVQLHLTRLVFADGYTATINAMQALTLPSGVSEPADGASESAQTQVASPVGNSFVSGQTTPSQTLPPLHSDSATTTLLAVTGAAVVGAIATIALVNRNKGRNSDYIVHDAGWQFQMKLEAPLSLDAGQVVLAASGK